MSAPRTVFLTGATGFIGQRVAAALLQRGDRVRCLVRDAGRAGFVADLGAELVTGDVTDRAAMMRGVAGVDAAIHLAAIYDLGVVDEGAMARTNVGGTSCFIEAIEAADVRRAIHVSTTVALGPVAVGVGDESTRNHAPYSSAYERTKTDAHELARTAQQNGTPLIIVCPAYVYGPGDNGPGGRFVRDLVRKKLPGLLGNPAWFSFVHVDDVVSGIIAALDRGQSGATYVLSGEDATINDYASRVASLAGVRAPVLRFPPPLARATGQVLDLVSRATGLRLPITRENVDTVSGHRWLHSHAKAAAELGYRARSLSEGLPGTVAWVREHHLR